MDWGHESRAQKDPDADANSEESHKRGGQGGQESLAPGAEGDAEGNSEHRVGDGGDPLDVKGVEPAVERILGDPPPGDDE